MKKLLVMDAKNYPPNMEEIYRVAVRVLANTRRMRKSTDFIRFYIP